jgi:iseA protein
VVLDKLILEVVNLKNIGKKIIITGLAVALFHTPFSNNLEVIFAKELPKTAQTSTQKNELTSQQAIQLAASFSIAASYVQRGGDYKPGEYKTFSFNGKTYRYLASNIDKKSELLNYLGKSLTLSASQKFMKASGIIEYKGKLAQPEADGGSLLQWEKATAQFIKTEKNTRVYRLTVPLGDNGEKDQYLVHYQYVQKLGWRLSSNPTFDQSVLTDKITIELASNLAQAVSFVQAGGSYQNGEYKTFAYNGKTYRYLSSQIDTKKELLNYLKNSLTHSAAEHFIRSKGIIEYKGKLAQVEADGGSILQWQKATTQFLKNDKHTEVYLISVPVGSTTEKQDFLVEYQYVEKVGWRISKEPYWNLDVPGNVNPAYNFFRHLLVDTKATQDLFLNPTSFNVEEFKKGIKKVEFVDMKEIDRNKSNVDFIVIFNAELDSTYRGSLVNGVNHMYFSIQPTGYMDFKIVKIGRIDMY